MRQLHALGIASAIWGAGLALPALAQQPAPAPSPTPAGPVAEQLVDLAPNHWSYGAIKVLMERYRVVAGYKDSASGAWSFRGEKTVSRYELAAALAQIMDRVQARGDDRVAPSDLELVDKLRKEFGTELGQIAAVQTQTKAIAQKTDEISKKTDAIATDVGALKTWRDAFVLPQLPAEKVKGRLDVTLMDDPEDTLFPYWTTAAQVTVKAKVSANVESAFTLYGGRGANKFDVSPAIAGADPSPKGSIGLAGNAALDAALPGDVEWKTQFGYFKLSGLMGLKGYAGHWWDGIIGAGLVPGFENPTRVGGRDMALGSRLTWHGVSTGTGVTSQIAAGYLGWDWSWGNWNFVADTDHDSINIPANKLGARDRPYAMATSLNFGSPKLGIMTSAGVKGTGQLFGETMQPHGGIEGIVNIGGVELVAGTDFKQGPEKANPTMQLRPTGYVFVPQLHPLVPTLLVGMVDVETISSSAGSGPGSRLGDKSGVTVQLGYDNPVLPNLTLEWNVKYDVLFGDYDGWGYAISTGVEF